MADQILKAGTIRPENVTSRLHPLNKSHEIVQLMSAKRTQFAPDDLVGLRNADDDMVLEVAVIGRVLPVRYGPLGADSDPTQPGGRRR